MEGVWGLREGVCDRGGGTAGVWDRAGGVGVAGVEGRDDMEADLTCVELNRERGDCDDEL